MRCDLALLPGSGGWTAFRAAKDMDMMLSVGTIKKAGDEIVFSGQLLSANRTMAGYRCFDIRMAMRATENMAESVLFPGEKDGFDLFSIYQFRLTYRTSASQDPSAGRNFRVLARSAGKEAVRKRQKQYADDYIENNEKGTRYHAVYIALFPALSQSTKWFIIPVWQFCMSWQLRSEIWAI